MKTEADVTRAFMTSQEVAKYLGCTQRTIYNKLRAGEIEAGKFLGRWKFRKSDIDAWIEKQERKTKKRKRGKLGSNRKNSRY